MKKYILMAEEGERQLLTDLGLCLEDYELIFTGVGAFNILKTCRDLDKDAEVLNVGYAGSSNFEVGTWVEVTEVRLNHPNVKYDEPTYRLIKDEGQLMFDDSQYTRAVCYSNCDFVLQSSYKDCVFDMELAFIVGLGFKNVRSLKYVSDNLSLHAYHELTNGVE